MHEFAHHSQAITLNYTSGTTGRPKGVVYHHRGAYLMSMGSVIAWNMHRSHFKTSLELILRTFVKKRLAKWSEKS
jgi:long-subunit acyl-CoA synthetase (AMP-forming)